MSDTILLGLIGDNIAASQSPRLHRLAGAQNGRPVRYDSLVPRVEGLDFDALFARCAAMGYRGVNVTYPYKEVVAGRLRVGDPLVEAIGACNTVLFGEGAPRGFNTDYSGFVAAYRRVRGTAAPGPVLVIGAGGVGRAVCFGLLALGAEEIRLADRDPAKAEALARALAAASPGLRIATGPEAGALAPGAAGLVNCTPLGMGGPDRAGGGAADGGATPLDGTHMAGAAWAFDAVYTPVDTRFLRDAQRAGLDVISGYELFVAQGVDAWAIFTGLPLDEDRLRADLAAGRDA